MSNILFYEPFYNVDRFLEQVQSGTDAGARQPERQGAVSTQPFKPRMDLYEDKEKGFVTATFELPGISKEDVRLEVHNDTLTIFAESKSSSEHEENGYSIRERRFGKFSRSLRLPQGIKDENVKATMADGVLTILFPRSSPEQEPKRITVS
ncbi:small heat shock protein [Macrolepiota fuliginosa MF-IS2]|uniref:Small heat shock protein n=1 Tax=Macrolepiota fuliginosa MF-IS2 TaxID=1400762 RepID=A0A9P5X5I7_9AGAR|nr:small heat shock protein [Macrolepiota fuliginosa MF-IS2]